MSAVDPHGLLAHVHPDLVKVILAASQDPQAFEVIQGLRTVAQEQAAVASGHSQTMHSRHLPNAQGVACAVDVAALVAGHIAWAPASLYAIIAGEVKGAARTLGIPVEWGGDWVSLKDYGHFQLPWAQYP